MNMQELKALSGGNWKALVAVLLLLLVVLVGGYFALTMNSDIAMPGTGYFAMVIGVIFSIVVGVGLMVLIFASGRLGYDDAPSATEKEDANRESPDRVPGNDEATPPKK